jgi:demethylmenaquinone methyltransferase/2-methoxy-6-polyprenyl-1,4-benzoquinol methylase
VPVGRDDSAEQTLARVFDEGAAAYDEYWAPALHRHACDLMANVPAAAPGSGRTVVDVAVGAGTLVPELRAVAGPDGVVLAMDRSLGMLRRATRDVPRIQADAARLPLADGNTDVVVLAFVLFMLPDARIAVAEAARVLRAGGWLLAATWGTPAETEGEVIVREEVEAAGPPPFPPLPRSDELTDSAERLSALLGSAGFDEVSTSERSLDAVFDARSTLAGCTGFGSLGWRYARLTASAQEGVRMRAAARLSRLSAEQFVDRSEVLLATARKHA